MDDLHLADFVELRLKSKSEFDAAYDVVFSTGYHGEFKPDQTRKCDLPECQISSKDEDWSLLNGCFHYFQIACLNESTSCPLCREFLQQKVKDLSEIAQQAILNPASDRPDSNNDNSETTTSSPSTDDMGNEHVDVRGMEREEFENVIGKLNDEIYNLNPPPQPHVISDAHHGLTSNTRTSTSKAPPHCTKYHHPVRGHKRSRSNSHITCNFCPNSICVSSSSECTCVWHRTNRSQSRSRQQTPQPATETQRIPVTVNQHLDLQDLNQTIPVYCQLIFKGNHIYSSFNLPPNQPNLDVKAVLQKKEASFQNIEMVADMGFFSSQDLEDYIVQYHALLVIRRAFRRIIESRLDSNKFQLRHYSVVQASTILEEKTIGGCCHPVDLEQAQCNCGNFSPSMACLVSFMPKESVVESGPESPDLESLNIQDNEHDDSDEEHDQDCEINDDLQVESFQVKGSFHEERYQQALSLCDNAKRQKQAVFFRCRI
ncbi:hypothetical protein OS493_035352 [Desmophyllum pertusum]|uniref:Uncharacterized protein n=1 Tax=Desmophyllum pertusum TaxID=174260 RepID=A0A9X0CCS6_9CNID|nr:hypothetical protein OS493_035352 [Desmophyllum pertusum]